MGGPGDGGGRDECARTKSPEGGEWDTEITFELTLLGVIVTRCRSNGRHVTTAFVTELEKDEVRTEDLAITSIKSGRRISPSQSLAKDDRLLQPRPKKKIAFEVQDVLAQISNH